MRRMLLLCVALALVLAVECGMHSKDAPPDGDLVRGPRTVTGILQAERRHDAKSFPSNKGSSFRDRDKATEGEAKWFLTDEEIAASRAGVSRAPMQGVTGGNIVRPLIDGERFMHELYADIENTLAGDYVHGTGFELGGNIMLWPRVPVRRAAANVKRPALVDNERTTLHSTLVRAIRRGVHVRMLVNKNVILRSATMSKADAFCIPLNDACKEAGGKTCCIADDRHNGKGGSMHGKMWVIGRHGGRRLTAYLGGMDVGSMRYDNSLHNNGALRRMQPAGLQPYYGWHDTMFQTQGPAATDLALHFYQRWNDDAKPSHWLVPGWTADYEKFAWVEPDGTGPQGALAVQVLRTLACKASARFGYYRGFAPYGEFTFRAAFKKLVANAQEYLHLEDQFMFYPWALHLVRKALPRIKKLVIITDTWRSMILRPMGVDVEMHAAAEMKRYYQAKAFDELLKPDEDGTTYHEKVHSYQLIRPEGRAESNNDLIYLHSKNYIADDEFMIVGSAGIEEAGFTNEEELAMGIYDRENGRGPESFVGRFRRRLWAEYSSSNLKKSSLWWEDIRHLVKSAETDGTPLRPYWPQSDVHDMQKAGELMISSLMNPMEQMISGVYKLYENNGECDQAEAATVHRQLVEASELGRSASLSGGSDPGTDPVSDESPALTDDRPEVAEQDRVGRVGDAPGDGAQPEPAEVVGSSLRGRPSLTILDTARDEDSIPIHEPVLDKQAVSPKGPPTAEDSMLGHYVYPLGRFDMRLQRKPRDIAPTPAVRRRRWL